MHVDRFWRFVVTKWYFIGVDGGGTKTETVLCDITGNVLFHHLLPTPTNPNDVGISHAVARLAWEIQLAKESVGREESAVFSVFCGISGALNHRDALLQGLCQNFPQDRITVDSDAANLLLSEVPVGDGCCLICGTGSVCFLKKRGEYFRIGGWGYLLDDSGSGYAMGREALEAVLRSYDGRGDATLLRTAVLKKMGKNPWENLSEIYEKGKAYIASFAPLVFDCEAAGDRISFEIISRQARYLAELLQAAFDRMEDSETGLTAVLGGSLFQKTDVLFEQMKREITSIPILLKRAEMPPVFGALCGAYGAALGEEWLADGYSSFRTTFRTYFS